MNLKKIERLSKKVYMICPNCSRKKLIKWSKEYWCIKCYTFFRNYLIEASESDNIIIRENIELSKDIPIKERRIDMETAMKDFKTVMGYNFDVMIF